MNNSQYKYININLYEESSLGNFLRDMYYQRLNIISDGFIVFLLAVSIYLSKNSNIVILLSASIILYIEYFVYFINFFFKSLVLENQFYLDSLILSYSSYDYIIFDDLDRLTYHEQNEFLRIISYFKKNLLSNQTIICVGNFNDIDKIFIDKFITKKTQIDKSKHIRLWVEEAKSEGYIDYIELYECVLHIFLPRLNYRLMNKFKEFIKHSDDNIINSFLVFYLLYYFEVDITKEQGIFRKEFLYNEVEHVLGELKKFNYSYDSQLFDKISELIISSKNVEEFYSFEFSTTDYSQQKDVGSTCAFKIIKNSTSSKKVITDKVRRDKPETTNLDSPITLVIYVYVSKRSIYIDDYCRNLITACNKVSDYRTSFAYHEKNIDLIKSNFLKDGKLPEINEELCNRFLELLDD